MDRIDLWVEVSKVEHQKLTDARELHEGTKSMRPRVESARKIQGARYKKAKLKIKTNGELTSKDLVKAINKKNVYYAKELKKAEVEQYAKPGDILFFMGAGDIDKIARELVTTQAEQQP